MHRPHEMTDAAWERVRKLRPEVRDRVLERASVLFYGGVVETLPEADRLALKQEAGVDLG